MIYAGDGHDHWHVRDLEDCQLRGLDSVVIISSSSSSSSGDSSTGIKGGFCFADGFRFDTKRPGAPARAVYSYAECGKPTDLSVRMGLSVGWGDPYLSTLPDQYIDVTRLPWGAYRLEATADASNWFHEADESNNTTWVDIRLAATKVTILGYGPSA
ncbi:MAG: lysyl oxidase family protein [Pseudonocardiaceae bacterium]